jgi:hypothetical protein
VDPAVLPPTGGQAEGTLVLTSPLPLPSGTVVKAEVTETYTLASAEEASEEKRSHDIVLHRGATAHGLRLTPCTAKDPGATALCAAFPITPARTFEAGELVEGKVHLDILAGREGVRGKVGGSEAVKVESAGGEASVFVPAQALPQNTAISVETSALSSYLPSVGGVVALAELVVDFSGQTLGLGAELAVLSPGVAAGTTLVVARVERVDGIPRLEVVSLARVETDGGGVERLVSEPFAGLSGVTKGGRYVFYRLGSPVGFVTGHTQQLGSGVAGVVVATSGLPFVGVSAGAGAYVVAAVPGEVTLTARKPRTSLQGQAGPVTVEAVPAAAAVRDILLEGTATVAEIVPVDGSKDVAVTQQLEVRSPTALQAGTVTVENVRLWRLEGAVETAVAVRLILSGSGRTVAIVPEARLAYEGTYRAEAVNLKDVLGADVVVAPSVFTTRKEIPPAAHPERMVFTFPDERGLVTVSGPGKAEAPPDGTYEAGTEILIINAGNGFVLTLSAGNDNEVPATEFPATINDRLMITVTDPFGKTTSFQRSQFVNPETGETAVGPGGGVVTGPGGVEVRIPEGALDKGAVLKITGLTPEALETEVGDEKVPNVPGAHLGSGLRVDAPSKPSFKKEVDLVFPMPSDVLSATAAEGKTAADAFFYVYRRVEGPNGAVFFQTLDYAQVECPGGAASCADDDKKVVTASFPFPGFGGIGMLWAAHASIAAHAYLMWTFNSLLPGQPTIGTITGASCDRRGRGATRRLRRRAGEGVGEGRERRRPREEPGPDGAAGDGGVHRRQRLLHVLRPAVHDGDGGGQGGGRRSRVPGDGVRGAADGHEGTPEPGDRGAGEGGAVPAGGDGGHHRGAARRAAAASRGRNPRDATGGWASPTDGLVRAGQGWCSVQVDGTWRSRGGGGGDAAGGGSGGPGGDDGGEPTGNGPARTGRGEHGRALPAGAVGTAQGAGGGAPGDG